MEPKPIKILIIDNVDDVVKDIADKLDEYYGDQLDIYPKLSNTDQTSPENQDWLIDHVKKGDDNQAEWDKIFNEYKYINVYIIDQCIEGEADTIGVHFARYILAKNRLQKIYMISRGPLAKPVTGKNVVYISKFGQPDFAPFLATTLGNNESLNKSLNKSLDIDEDIEKPSPNQPDNKEEQDTDAFIKKEKTKKDFILWTDRIITYSFVVTIIGVSLISFLSLLISFILDLVKKLLSISITAEEGITKQHNESTSILEHSEYVFLYILPIFILYGFYIFYYSKIRVLFLGGQILPQENGLENSEKLMSFTKIMFISSIVSFAIVKIIDICIGNDFNLTKVLVLGGLLLILMAYFIILERIEKKEIKKGKQ